MFPLIFINQVNITSAKDSHNTRNNYYDSIYSNPNMYNPDDVVAIVKKMFSGEIETMMEFTRAIQVQSILMQIEAVDINAIDYTPANCSQLF